MHLEKLRIAFFLEAIDDEFTMVPVVGLMAWANGQPVAEAVEDNVLPPAHILRR